MGLYFDLFFIVVIILTAVISAKRGFVRTFLELAGFIAAIVIAFTISTPIAEFAFNSFVEPAITENVGEVIVENATEIPQNFWDKMPEIVKDNSHYLGVNESTFSDIIADEIEKGSTNITNVVTEQIIKPAFVGILSAILNILLILILIPLFKFIAKFLNKLFSFSFVGKLNRTLGAITGGLEGAAICIVLCLLLLLISKSSPNGFWIIKTQNLNNSYVYSLIQPIIS